MSKCPKHPDVDLFCPACIGARGGSAGTKAQKAAHARAVKFPRRRTYPQCKFFKYHRFFREGRTLCRCGVRKEKKP